jgi:hypothetical protein
VPVNWRVLVLGPAGPQHKTENESPAPGPTSGALQRTQCRAGCSQHKLSPPVYLSRWSLAALRSPAHWYSRCGSLRYGQESQQLDGKAASALYLQHPLIFSTLIEFCERDLKIMCAASAATRAQRVTPLPLATRERLKPERVRPGARSIPYYHNALGDLLRPRKTVRCAESSTRRQRRRVCIGVKGRDLSRRVGDTAGCRRARYVAHDRGPCMLMLNMGSM